MAWIIQRSNKKPIGSELAYSPNYGWIWPLLSGWQKVYFYASRKTAESAIHGSRYLRGAIAKEVVITVAPV